MYKNRKATIHLLIYSFIFLTLLEFIRYLFANSNIYGLVYLIINAIIMFLMIPITYNYNRYYSSARISKLIIIIVLGLFNNFLLNLIIQNTINYIDESNIYISAIFLTKNILKPIIYLLLTLFTISEFRLKKVITKTNVKK